MTNCTFVMRYLILVSLCTWLVLASALGAGVLPNLNCTSFPSNEPQFCKPDTSLLNLYTSFSSENSCGAPPQQVCWNVSGIQTECRLCNTDAASNSYPLSNLVSKAPDVWISDGADEEATFYLNFSKLHLLSRIAIKFASILPREVALESYKEAESSFSAEHYFTDNCSSLPPSNQQICSEYVNQFNFTFSPYFGIETTGLRIILKSHMRDGQNSYYSQALEYVEVYGACVCNGHASSCSGRGADRTCDCEHDTAGRDCDTCEQYFYPAANRSLSDPSYCEGPILTPTYSDLLSPRYDVISFSLGETYSQPVRFSVCIREEGAEGCEREKIFDSSQVRLTQLASLTNYTITVVALTELGESPPLVFSAVTSEQSLFVTPISATELQVSWNPPIYPDPPTSYLLCTRVSQEAPCSALLLEGEETSTLVSSLDPGTTYYISVTPYFGAREGTEYPRKAATTPESAICDCELCGVEDEFQPCDAVTKQCICKRNAKGTRCDECKAGFHTLSFSNEIGCQECACGMGGSSSLPCDPETGLCRCKQGFIGSSCEVSIGHYTPSLEQLFSITEVSVSELDRRDYLLTTAVAIPSRTGWRVSSEQKFRIEFSVDESGDYFFRPLISLSLTATAVSIQLTSEDTNTSYSIPAGGLDGWIGEVALAASELYTVSVGVEPDGSLAVVEDLLFLPLDVAATPQEREVLRNVYTQCVPYPWLNDTLCSEATSISATFVQSASDCDCERIGSVSNICATYGGQCLCSPNFGGRRCDQCTPGSWMGTDGSCLLCNCDPQKSETLACNSTGYCYCTDVISTDATNRTCSSCNPGYTLESNGECTLCDCGTTGSLDNSCDSTTGDCSCKPGYEGDRCQSCQPLHLENGDQCTPCPCPGDNGTMFADGCSIIEGIVSCSCLNGYTGSNCNACDEGYYAEYTETGELRNCRDCDCNGNGAEVSGKLCDETTGQCLNCVGNTRGNQCEECKAGFYQAENTQGRIVCEACDCDVTGSEDVLCDSKNGVCLCREGFSGVRCDQCATNNYRLSNGCPSCSNCFNEVYETYTSLRSRLDWYKSFSDSGCNLLSSRLRLLLESYTQDVAMLLADINIAETTDSRLYSSLNNFTLRIMQLNDDVVRLETLTNQLETRALDMQEESQINLERVTGTLFRIGDIFQTYYFIQILVNQASQYIIVGINGVIQDILTIITREGELVQEQGELTSQTVEISAEVLTFSEETLSRAQGLVELHSNLTSLIRSLFQLQTSIQNQVNMIILIYPESEEAANSSESLYREILALVRYPPIEIPVFSDEELRQNVSSLEEYVRRLKNESLTQTQDSNEEIGRASVLIETGKFLRNVTNDLLNRLWNYRAQALNAVETANNYINILKSKSSEINLTYDDSTLLVELMNQFFDLLNETQQNVSIENAQSTLAVVQGAIDDVTRLEQLITTTCLKSQKSELDANSANRTVEGISKKIRNINLDIEEIEINIKMVEDRTQELETHEVEGRDELEETDSTLDNVVLYTRYLEKRVELLELEYLKLNRSLEGIDIVSEEEVESIIMRISNLEKSLDKNQQELDSTEEELREEKADLEDLEKAVYESYSQVREFDSLIGDIKLYNDEHSCN